MQKWWTSSKRIITLSLLLMFLLSNFNLVGSSGEKENGEFFSEISEDIIMGVPAGWSDDIRLSYTINMNLSFYPRNYSVYPQIASNGNYLHVVWQSLEVTKAFGSPFQSTSNVIYIRGTNNGQSLSEPITLSNMTSGLWNDQHSAGHPRIAINGNNVHVVWDEIMGADNIYRIMYRKSIDNGKTWGQIVNITPYTDTIWRYNPDIAVWNDTVHIVWDEGVSSDEEIFYVNSKDNGDSWNSPQRITFNSANSDTAPHISVYDQKVHITWTRFLVDAEIMYIRSNDSADSWEPEALLSLDDGWGSGVTDMAVNGSNLHFAMVEDKHLASGGKRQAYYMNSTNHGSSFNPQYGKKLTNTDIYNRSGAESIDVTGNIVHVTYYDERDGGQTEIYYMNSTDNGLTWSSDLRLTYSLNSSACHSDISVNNNLIHIVFQDNRTGDSAHSSEIFYKRYPDFPTDTTPPTIVHTPITESPNDQQIDILANVTDDFEVSNVTLYYENVGDTTYTAVDMVLISGNWTATIPAQTETGLLHYFILANDASGNNITSPIMGDYAIQVTGPPNIEITNPLGGEDWTGGSNHQIEFIASDTEDLPAVLDVFLNYTSGAGNGVIASIKGDDSPYDWTLPIINATDVIVNATIVDSDGNKTYDDSLEFTINSSPPKVISTNPANNTTGIFIFQPIVIQFNEKMNISSVIVNQTNGTDPGGWSWFWNEDKDTITGIHDSWPRGENVAITVQAGYKDYSDPGNANNTEYIFSFTTEINPSPEIMHTNISGSQELGGEIRINATITDDGQVMNAVLWWQDVDDIWHENYMDKNGNDWEYTIPAQMTMGKVKYQINATDDFGQKNTTILYEFDIRDSTPPVIIHTPVESAVVGEAINITCEITDLGGVDITYMSSGVFFVYRYEGDTDFIFRVMNPEYWYEIPAHSAPVTIEYYIWASDIYGNKATTNVYSLEISEPDTTPPEVLLATPTGDYIPISTDISIVFSEAMNRTSVENAISVSPDISFSSSWTNNQTLLLSITGNLSYNTTYTGTINTGAKDLAGNTLANDYSWQFSMVGEPEIVQQPAPNDWGWIVIIILLITIIMLMLFYQFNKEKKKEK